MRTESHIFVITIAHAELTLAQQRVRDCELNSNKSVAGARAAATLAADELAQAIKTALAIETTP